jgi:hypothetical protein
VTMLNHTIKWYFMKNSKLNQVGNFEKLVSFTNAQGPVYNPSKASIEVAALQTLLTQAQGAMQAADVSRTAYEDAINARQQVFKTIPRQARRIIAALKANGAPPEVIDDVMAIKRRFSPGRKILDKPPAQTSSTGTPGTPDGDENGAKFRRRISQLDLDSRIGNFQKLVIRATAEPLYKPNETDLQTAALNTFVATLRTRNTNVINAFIALKDADQTVNKTLYDSTGIYGQASAAKAYIESIFGFRSIKHKEVTSLKFLRG